MLGVKNNGESAKQRENGQRPFSRLDPAPILVLPRIPQISHKVHKPNIAYGMLEKLSIRKELYVFYFQHFTRLQESRSDYNDNSQLNLGKPIIAIDYSRKILK